MAAGSLLALLDDITAILDDMATMAKIAAKKTAGVVGDDLALNARQVAGAAAEREWPIIWEVTKGSFKNKAILIPGALALSFAAPWAITPILMAGGLYLCYEGGEKILEKIHEKLGRGHGEAREKPEPGTIGEAREQIDEELFDENDKIKGAVRTDLILSGEIIVIALGTVAAAPFLSQLAVLSAVGVGMTVLVYGSVAGLVKIDDAGFRLMESESAAVRKTGEMMVRSMPGIMKTLTVLGTAAMFTVGGGIIAHGAHLLPPLSGAAGIAAEALVGLVAGLASIPAVEAFNKHIAPRLPRLFGKKEKSVDPDEKNEPETADEPSPSPSPAPSPKREAAAPSEPAAAPSFARAVEGIASGIETIPGPSDEKKTAPGKPRP